MVSEYLLYDTACSAFTLEFYATFPRFFKHPRHSPIAASRAYYYH